MKGLYAIVHESEVFDGEVIKEIGRIKQEEEYYEIKHDILGWVPEGTGKKTLILVCGAYVELCAGTHYQTLKLNGYNAKMHWPGCQFGCEELEKKLKANLDY